MAETDEATRNLEHDDAGKMASAQIERGKGAFEPMAQQYTPTEFTVPASHELEVADNPS